MQDENSSQKDNSPMITAEMPKEGERGKHIEHSSHSKSHEHGFKNRMPLIIGIIVGVIVIVVAGVLIAIGINNQSEQISESEYSIQRDPETGERPLFGTDPNKDNSGEAYVKYLQRIINAKDTTDAERFDARISIAVYYNAIGEYDEAIEAMNTMSANSLSASQQQRFYNVFASIYENKGDNEKAEEYRKLASSDSQAETVEETTEVVEQTEVAE